MYLSTDLGPGLVHDRDLARALAALAGHGDGDDFVAALLEGEVSAIRLGTGAAEIPLTRIVPREFAERFHFVTDPQPD